MYRAVRVEIDNDVYYTYVNRDDWQDRHIANNVRHKFKRAVKFKHYAKRVFTRQITSYEPHIKLHKCKLHINLLWHKDHTNGYKMLTLPYVIPGYEFICSSCETQRNWNKRNFPCRAMPRHCYQCYKNAMGYQVAEIQLDDNTYYIFMLRGIFTRRSIYTRFTARIKRQVKLSQYFADKPIPAYENFQCKIYRQSLSATTTKVLINQLATRHRSKGYKVLSGLFRIYNAIYACYICQKGCLVGEDYSILSSSCCRDCNNAVRRLMKAENIKWHEASNRLRRQALLDIDKQKKYHTDRRRQTHISHQE